MPVYMDSPAREEQTKKERASLLGADGSRTLPDPSTLKDGWVAEREGMNQWPHANLSDITINLMKDHPGNDASLQKRLLNEYKGKAYRLKQISIHHVNNDFDYCFMKAQCTRIMKINDVPHDLWTFVRKATGDIHSAFCSCTAG